MLWTGVLSRSDITNNKAAWNTFVWFATLVALADGLSSTGFIARLGKEGGALMSGISPGVATIVLLLAFYLLHYLFASTTAHTTALLPAMLTIASTIPGMNMQVFVLLMVTSLGVMGIITPYGTGPSPIYYGSGYLPTKDYWRLGTIFGAIFPGRPAADWLSVDVHDVLIHNRRVFPGGFYLYGVCEYVDENPLFIKTRSRWRMTIPNTICSAKSTSPSPNSRAGEVLKVEPQALTLLAQQGLPRCRFLCCASRISSRSRPFCSTRRPAKTTNTSRCSSCVIPKSPPKVCCPPAGIPAPPSSWVKKGQRVWTGGGDEAALAQGVYNTYTEDNLRYSQNAPLDMYKEVNTGTNLPAQIDLYSVDGDEYKFPVHGERRRFRQQNLSVPRNQSVNHPGEAEKNYLVEKMRTLGTAACPPYHIAFVIGGTSAEATLKTVKLASARYYDDPADRG